MKTNRPTRRTTIKAILKLWTRYKGWEAARLLRRSIFLRPEIFQEFIQERAGELALRGTLGFLEREGILHCVKCPRRGPLRKVGAVYACPKHADEIMAAMATARGRTVITSNKAGTSATVRQAVPA